MAASGKIADVGTDCFTCAAAGDPPQPELVAYRGDLMLVNHYHSGPGEPERTGWFIVAPVRHVCRWFELTRKEQHALAETAAAVDEALTRVVFSRRSMVSSLGWHTLDHLHVHVVPTVTFPVTYGWELFGGERYTPLGVDPATVTEQVRNQLLLLL